MANALSADFKLSVQARLTGDSALGGQSEVFELKSNHKFANGSATGQADRVFHKLLSLEGTITPFTADLNSGGNPPSQEVFEASVDRFFATVRAIYVANLGTQQNQTITVGASGSNFMSDLFAVASTRTEVAPGDIWAITARHDGYALTASTDKIRIGALYDDIVCPAELVIVGTAV